MNKAVVALSVAMALGGMNANAGTIYKNENGDNLKVYGGAEVGGTLLGDKDKRVKTDGKAQFDQTYVDDSFATIGLKGQTGDIYAKFEMDAERQNWNSDNNIRFVVDKMYVGYKLGNNSFEFGRTDTAYDHVDGFGDVTNELGVGISEAGDQDNTIKYRGKFGAVRVGISHSMTGWDGTMENGEPKEYSYETDSLYGEVTNGYIGYYGDTFTVIAGAENGKETEIYSLHAKAKFGDWTIAGLAFDETKNFNGDKSSEVQEKGYNLGFKYAMTEKLNLLANVNYSDPDNYDEASQWVVAGAEYKYAKNIKLAAEIASGDVYRATKKVNGNRTTDSGVIGYVKAFYWF